MMRLRELKAPKSSLVERRLQHVARCAECGEHWRVPSTRLGEAHQLRRGEHTADASLAGPMWVGPIHDGEQQMAENYDDEADSADGIDDAITVLGGVLCRL